MNQFRLEEILRQVEFYFSDANISKNRAFREMIEPNNWQLSSEKLLSHFNRMKELEVGENELHQALLSSKKIELKNGNVCRKTQYVEVDQNEADERTIYVEGSTFDVRKSMSVQSIVDKMGKGVVYVSVPKFPSNGQSKGFAFVEFRNRKRALAAVEKMSVNGKVKGIFPRGNKQFCALEKRIGSPREPPKQDDPVVNFDLPYRAAFKKDWQDLRNDHFKTLKRKLNEMIKQSNEGKSPKSRKIVFEDSD